MTSHAPNTLCREGSVTASGIHVVPDAMRSIERLSGPEAMSWPECTRDALGMDAPALALVAAGALPGFFFVLVVAGFAFVWSAGFFFVVSPTPGIVCPSCWAKAGVPMPANTARAADRTATYVSDIV